MGKNRNTFLHGNGRMVVMTMLVLCTLLGTATQAQAQTMMPLPAYGSTYTSTQIRGFWFQAPTDFTIV